MQKKVISTNLAPAAVGPYSQGIVAPQGRTIYASGQLPLDLETGELISENFEAQARQAFKNLQAVLAAEGARLEHEIGRASCREREESTVVAEGAGIQMEGGVEGEVDGRTDVRD